MVLAGSMPQKTGKADKESETTELKSEHKNTANLRKNTSEPQTQIRSLYEHTQKNLKTLHNVLLI